MMKARKGFTLVELMIVVGIIGVLSAMGLIAGQGATSAAKAATILENLHQAEGAMMSYYQLNMDAIDKSGVKAVAEVKDDDGNITTPGVDAVNAAAKIAAGANIYLKGDSALGDGDAASLTGGAYYVKTVGEGANQQWWVLYQFTANSTGDAKVKEVLASKGGLIGTVPTAAGGTATDFSSSSEYVAIKVR